MPSADQVIHNIHIASFDPSRPSSYGAITDAVLAVANGKILWLGAADDAPEFEGASQFDGKGQWMTPGLIDCHSHVVYGGNRAREFEARLKGESYESISRKGGGIASTVKATRLSSEADLLQSALRRVDALLAEGVTTLEVKSGYGLDLENEMKMLRVADQLSKVRQLSVRKTFLGAHALPEEFKLNADGFIDLLVDSVMPALVKENLIDAVDVFCEGIGFSPEQCRRVFEKARSFNLPVKGHVEQLSDLKGARLVAEFDGLSVDHIEYLVEDDIPHLLAASVVAVLLPGAFYSLNETRKPPVDALRSAGVPMAVATDLNPGTSPIASLLLALNQSCVLFGLTPEEALTGATRHAASALDLADSKGQLKIGFDADLALWDISHPSELCYGVNMHKPSQVWHCGKPRDNNNV